jgi:hypothetical protein
MYYGGIELTRDGYPKRWTVVTRDDSPDFLTLLQGADVYYVTTNLIDLWYKLTIYRYGEFLWSRQAKRLIVETRGELYGYR